jgi:hypothetical protein
VKASHDIKNCGATIRNDDFRGRKKMKTSIKMTLAAVALGLTGVANAAKITSWDYTNEAGFLDPVSAGAIAIDKTGFQSAGSTILGSDTWTGLDWGTPVVPADGNSSLEILTPVTGTIITDGDFEDGTDITHNNFRITNASEAALTNAKILDGLALNAASWNVAPDPGLPALLGGLAPELLISFEFLETPNNGGADSTCEDGSAPGTDPLLPNFGCDDFFIIEPIAGVDIIVDDGGDLDPSNDFLQFTTTFDLIDLGFPAAVAASLDLITKYEVVTRLTGLSINTLFCGTQAVPCLGFSTEELKVNTLQASFAIRAVPAPASLAFLGLGLFALGMNARRKRA